jgi:Ca-activated chloride channel homolog
VKAIRIGVNKGERGVPKSHRGVFLLAAICAATASVFCCLGIAQDPRVSIGGPIATGNGGGRTPAGPAPDIKVTADLVLIPVTVTDDNDQVITGLGKENFRLYDNKVEMEITQFAREDAPVSVGIVFDCSGSMGAKLGRARAAVVEFMRTANPEDEFALVAFSDRVRVLSDFTSRSEEIQYRLLLMRSGGETALLDAVYLMVQRLEHAKYSRKAILIISDGGDNASRYTSREVKGILRESDVQVFAIGIFEPSGLRGRTPEELLGPSLLNEMARETGGRLFEVDGFNDLEGAASEIGMALRSRYVLGFAPIGQRDGKYHRVQVKVPKVNGWPTLRATFRSGYYAR